RTTATHPFRHSSYSSLTSPYWSMSLETNDAGMTQSPIDFRHPFLDTRVVRFLLSVPSIPWCVDKFLLRESMRGLLPDEIRRRRKAGLSADPTLVALRQRRPAAK